MAKLDAEKHARHVTIVQGGVFNLTVTKMTLLRHQHSALLTGEQLMADRYLQEAHGCASHMIHIVEHSDEYALLMLQIALCQLCQGFFL